MYRGFDDTVVEAGAPIPLVLDPHRLVLDELVVVEGRHSIGSCGLSTVAASNSRFRAAIARKKNGKGRSGLGSHFVERFWLGAWRHRGRLTPMTG